MGGETYQVYEFYVLSHGLFSLLFIFHKYFTFCKWDNITEIQINIIIKEFYLKSKM